MERIITIQKSDFRFDFMRGTGKGGQKRNKTSSACRCTHLATGLVGYSEDSRQQHLNRKNAWLKIVKTDKFKKWLRAKAYQKLGYLAEIEKKVDDDLSDRSKIKIEIHKNGRWEDILI